MYNLIHRFVHWNTKLKYPLLVLIVVGTVYLLTAWFNHSWDIDKWKIFSQVYFYWIYIDVLDSVFKWYRQDKKDEQDNDQIEGI